FALRDLHSFPTRRSSDLGRRRKASPRGTAVGHRATQQEPVGHHAHVSHLLLGQLFLSVVASKLLAERPWIYRVGNENLCRTAVRSEEHTSELQSPCNLVC